MSARTIPSIVDIFTTLPARQQKRLTEEAWSYHAALDRAISLVLAPNVGRAGDQFMAVDEIIPLYGVGATPQEAMADYRSVVVEYYESLEEDADELAPSLQKQLDVLRHIFTLLDQGRLS